MTPLFTLKAENFPEGTAAFKGQSENRIVKKEEQILLPKKYMTLNRLCSEHTPAHPTARQLIGMLVE